MNQVRLKAGRICWRRGKPAEGRRKVSEGPGEPKAGPGKPTEGNKEKEVAEDPLEIKGSLQAIMLGNKLDSRTTDLINDQKIKIWLVAMLIYSGCILFRSRM